MADDNPFADPADVNPFAVSGFSANYRHDVDVLMYFLGTESHSSSPYPATL